MIVVNASVIRVRMSPGDRARLGEGRGAGLGDLGDRVVGRGGAILCGPGGNGDEDSFEKVTAFPAPEP